MEEKILTIPAVALRGMTILPGMIAHFDISRERSLKAVEASMREEQQIFLVTQKDVEQENPKLEDLFSMGVVAEVRQVVRLQNDIVRVLAEGIARAEIRAYHDGDAYIEAQVVVQGKDQEETLPEQEKSAMILSVQETFAKFVTIHGKIGKDVQRKVNHATGLSADRKSVV